MEHALTKNGLWQNENVLLGGALGGQEARAPDCPQPKPATARGAARAGHQFGMLGPVTRGCQRRRVRGRLDALAFGPTFA